jgi:hypothetical protein
MADRELQALERGGTCESTGDRCDEVCGWSVERVVVVVVVVSGHGSHHGGVDGGGGRFDNLWYVVCGIFAQPK